LLTAGIAQRSALRPNQAITLTLASPYAVAHRVR